METEFTTSDQLNRMMSKIQALITQADHPGTGEEEAATFRAKAEELMRKYRVAEEDLIATDQVDLMPIVHRLWLGALLDHSRGAANGKKVKSSFYQQWYHLLADAAAHAGCQIHNYWAVNPETKEYGLWGVIVGYEGDVRLAEMLYSSARLVFSEKIEPKVDRGLSDAENIYRLRSAGITRRKVAAMIWNLDTHAAHATVGRVYKTECERRGEVAALDGRGVSADAFRDAYARSFVDGFSRLLRRSRDAADSTGGALLLHGRAERVKEALWAAYPMLRPTDLPAVPEKSPAKAKKVRRMTQAELNRLYGAAATAGAVAGRKAAADININRVAPAKRVQEAGPAGALES